MTLRLFSFSKTDEGNLGFAGNDMLAAYPLHDPICPHLTIPAVFTQSDNRRELVVLHGLWKCMILSSAGRL